MITKQDILDFINANIVVNGNNRITGDVMNNALSYMLQNIADVHINNNNTSETLSYLDSNGVALVAPANSVSIITPSLLGKEISYSIKSYDLTGIENLISAETQNRQNADNDLQSNITTEAQTRAAADAVLQGQIETLNNMPNLDLATQTTPGIVKLAAADDVTNRTPGVAVTPDVLPATPPPATLLQVLGTGNISTPNTSIKPIIQLDDSGVLTSIPVEGAIEIKKGTDPNNPNLDGGGFNFTKYNPRYGVYRQKLHDTMFSHYIGRQNAVRVNYLLDTNPYYVNKTEFIVRCFPVCFGSGGAQIVVNLSFDNQSTWVNLWTANTIYTGSSQNLTCSQPIDVMIDAYYRTAGFCGITDTYNPDGTITTVKKFVQVDINDSVNIMAQFASVGAENVGMHYQVIVSSEQQFGPGT